MNRGMLIATFVLLYSMVIFIQWMNYRKRVIEGYANLNIDYSKMKKETAEIWKQHMAELEKLNSKHKAERMQATKEALEKQQKNKQIGDVIAGGAGVVATFIPIVGPVVGPVVGMGLKYGLGALNEKNTNEMISKGEFE